MPKVTSCTKLRWTEETVGRCGIAENKKLPLTKPGRNPKLIILKPGERSSKSQMVLVESKLHIMGYEKVG